MCFYIHIYLKLVWHEFDLNFFQIGMFPNVFCAMTLFFDISVNDIPIIKQEYTFIYLDLFQCSQFLLICRLGSHILFLMTELKIFKHLL